MKFPTFLLCFIAFHHVGYGSLYLTPPINNLETLLLTNMNLSVNPCEDFYNFVCGRFNDKDDVATVQKDRIIQNAMIEARKPEYQDSVYASSAIQKALAYHSTCEEAMSESTSQFPGHVRVKVHQFMENFKQIPANIFFQDNFDFWIRRGDWTDMLKYVFDNFNVQPFFSLVRSEDNNSSKIEDDKTLEIRTIKPTFSPLYYLCSQTNELFEKFEFAVRKVAKTMKFYLTKRKAKQLAVEFIKLEFELIGENGCIESIEKYFEDVGEEENVKFITIPKLENEKMFFDIKRYLMEILETGAPGKDTLYDSVTLKFDQNFVDYLNNIFETYSDAALVRYMYFRMIHKAIQYPTECLKFLSHLPLLKSRIYTEFKYANIMERESMRGMATMMLNTIKMELEKMITSIDWIQADKETYKKLVNKFSTMKAHIAIADEYFNNEWIDAFYEQLEIVDGDEFLDMHSSLLKFLNYNFIRKLFSNETVYYNTDFTEQNAFFDFTQNTLVIFDGILVSPFYHGNFPLSFNMGGTGSTIGHEIAHAFDNDGVNYNGTGVYYPISNGKTLEKWSKMKSCVVEQYDQIQVLPDSYNPNHVNGERTLGENIADISGLDAAYRAYKVLERRFGRERRLRWPTLRRFTQDQIFFLGYGTSFCEKPKNNDEIKADLSDEHSPNPARVLGALQNLPAFAAAYRCPVGSKYNPVDQCKVWTS